MSERADTEVVIQPASTSIQIPSEAVRMCSGPCGEMQLCTSFPIGTGQPDTRYDECTACRDDRLQTNKPAAVPGGAKLVGTKGFPAGGRRATLRAQRTAIAEHVAAVVMAHSGQAVSISQVYQEVLGQLEFIPLEADVRASLRTLVKSDERYVRLNRETYAWVLPGEATPPPPAPHRVIEMIERRSRGLTLDDIGSEFGVTRERVRQLLKKHGGPSADQICNLRAAEERSLKDTRAEAVSQTVRAALEGRGPTTVAEMVEITGLDSGEVSKHWPKDLAHLRLWGTRPGDSRWTDEDIYEALRRAAEYEFPLTTKAYSGLLQVGQISGPSVPRIGQRFGSWRTACEAAGVVAGDPWNREYESRWSDEDLLQIARSYLMDANAPNSANRFDEWKRVNAPDGPSAQTLRNRFRSWTEVKRRALAQGGPTT